MTWNDVENEIIALSAQINFSPDVIVGITKGGVIPARLLCRSLHIDDLYSVTVKKVGHKRKILSAIMTDFKDKKVLLVEDILETGKSLRVASDFFADKGAIVKTACLYTMPHTDIRPDYSLRVLTEVVQFPWE